MSNLEIYCVTNKKINFIKKNNYYLAAVGKNNFPKKYIKCNTKKNIYYKEKNYSELTFHYWFWKNKLNNINQNKWVGFCQKRRFWVKSKKSILKNNINDILLTKPHKDWKNYDAIICSPIQLSTKFSKLLKRGWKNIIFQPSLLFNYKEITIKVHFDMHHGFNIISRAAKLINNRDKKDFIKFIENKKKFNPHIMFISKKKILNRYFSDQFTWLRKCEKVFGIKKLKNYDQTRLYAFLSERYTSFWFRKHTKYLEWPWIFYEEKKYNIKKNN